MFIFSSFEEGPCRCEIPSVSEHGIECVPSAVRWLVHVFPFTIHFDVFFLNFYIFSLDPLLMPFHDAPKFLNPFKNGFVRYSYAMLKQPFRNGSVRKLIVLVPEDSEFDDFPRVSVLFVEFFFHVWFLEKSLSGIRIDSHRAHVEKVEMILNWMITGVFNAATITDLVVVADKFSTPRVWRPRTSETAVL